MGFIDNAELVTLTFNILGPVDKDEDQNLTNEEDLVEGCQAVRNVLKLQLLGWRLVTYPIEVL